MGCHCLLHIKVQRKLNNFSKVTTRPYRHPDQTHVSLIPELVCDFISKGGSHVQPYLLSISKCFGVSLSSFLFLM